MLTASFFAIALTSCIGPFHRPRQAEGTIAEAEAATAAQRWSLAAERWYGLYAASGNKSAHACAETARAEIELGHAASANHMLEECLQRVPDDPDLLELDGRALGLLGYARAAADCYGRALDVDPKRTSALLALGKTQLALGLERSAVKQLEHAIELGAESSENWALLAKARRTADDPAGAYLAYAKAFELGPGIPDDLLSASTLCCDDAVRAKHPEVCDRAREWLMRVTKDDPQNVHAEFQLGVLAEELGQQPEALAHYRRAVELDPECLISLRNLAVMYAGLGDTEHTREIVERALAIEQDPERRKELAKLLDKGTPTLPKAPKP